MQESLELAYLAGFFDGEGCVHVSRPNRSGRQCLYVVVSQTDPAVLLAFESRWGGRVRTKSQSGERNANCKPIWVWGVYSQEGAACLRDLLPYLRVKAAQAEIGIRFQGWKSGDNDLRALKAAHPRRTEILAERAKAHAEIAVLNKRGK